MNKHSSLFFYWIRQVKIRELYMVDMLVIQVVSNGFTHYVHRILKLYSKWKQ